MLRFLPFRCLSTASPKLFGNSHPDQQDAARLIKALRDGQYDTEEKDGITKYTLKSKDLPWLYQDNFDEPLIVRQSTKDIFQIIDNDARRRHVLITGHPGIGKTWMHNYFLLKWIPKMKKDDIFLLHKVQSGRHLIVVDDCGDSVMQIPNPSKELFVLSNMPNVTYLADTGGPGINDPLPYFRRTILTSSPSLRHYQTFLAERKPLWLHHAPWQLEELLAARPASISEEEVKRRFGLVGGIPRHVFAEDVMFDWHANRVDGAITDVEWTRPYRWQMGDQLELSHRIFAVHPCRPNYTSFKVDFLCDNIKKKVKRHLRLAEAAAGATFMHITYQNPKFAVVWGLLYELQFFSHLKNLKGKPFCLPLEPLLINQRSNSPSSRRKPKLLSQDTKHSSGPIERLEITVGEVANPDEESELNDEVAEGPFKGKVVQIEISNFATIDGLILDGSTMYGLQVTKQELHSAALKGLKKMNEWRTKHGYDQVVLIFIHPEDVAFKGLKSKEDEENLKSYNVDAYHAVWDQPSDGEK